MRLLILGGQLALANVIFSFDKLSYFYFQAFGLFILEMNAFIGVDPTKLFFLCFFSFGVKLGHFTINKYFLYVTKTQAYQQKTEKFFVSEEKKFDRIDSCCMFQ